MGRANFGHYVAGLAGFALLRTWLAGPRETADARLADLQRLVRNPDQPPLSLEQDVPGESVASGYARWAGTYDHAPNPLIRREEPVVHALVDGVPPGTALDAACGTGRHAKYLRQRGHRVIGVDATPAMLEQARTALPDLDFRVGDLSKLPVESASVDVAVCALALAHCPNLEEPIAELARTLRPGGRLIVSDLHPMIGIAGGGAYFVGTDGRPGLVQGYNHIHATYLAAFRAAGLAVRQCLEPLVVEEDLAVMSGGLVAFGEDVFRTALVGLPFVLVWEAVRPAV